VKEEKMRKSAISYLVISGAVALASLSFISQPVSAEEASMVDEGQKVAYDRKKGNCIACHKMAGGSQPGNIGPELVNMKARYPDKAALRAKIWDATVTNPTTIMPPFGKHKIVNEKELDNIVEFIYTL
jgi:sulfur-oxidizing protein SoxX